MSYFLLVWSEWDGLYFDPTKVETSLVEDFRGVEVWRHREDLIQRLEYILRQLDLGREYIQQHNPWMEQELVQRVHHQYHSLRDVLVGVDGTATPTWLICEQRPCQQVFQFS